VGRDETDNRRLLAAAEEGETLLEVRDAGSPITLLSGMPTDLDIRRAAALTARYSDRKREALVTVTVTAGEKETALVVTPATEEICARWRIVSDAPVAMPAHAAE